MPPFMYGEVTGSMGGQAGGYGVQPEVWEQVGPQDPGVQIRRHCSLSRKFSSIRPPRVSFVNTAPSMFRGISKTRSLVMIVVVLKSLLRSSSTSSMSVLTRRVCCSMPAFMSILIRFIVVKTYPSYVKSMGREGEHERILSATNHSTVRKCDAICIFQLIQNNWCTKVFK